MAEGDAGGGIVAVAVEGAALIGDLQAGYGMLGGVQQVLIDVQFRDGLAQGG